MLSGFIVVGIGAVLICICAVVIYLRTPECPKCHIPLQAIEESVRDLGPYGVETVTYYACSDCYRDLQRVFVITHFPPLQARLTPPLISTPKVLSVSPFPATPR